MAEEDISKVFDKKNNPQCVLKKVFDEFKDSEVSIFQIF